MEYITLDWAEDRRACAEAVEAFRKEFGTEATTKEVLDWLNRIDKQGWLGWIMGQDNLNITRELLNYGADIHSHHGYALREASSAGRLETVKFLMEHGADIRADGVGALGWAALFNRLDLVKFLVAYGVDVHAGDDFALLWARNRDHKEVVKFLEQVGGVAGPLCQPQDGPVNKEEL